MRSFSLSRRTFARGVLAAFALLAPYGTPVALAGLMMSSLPYSPVSALTAFLLLRWNPLAALLLALLAWGLVSFGLYFLFRMTGLFVKLDRLVANAPNRVHRWWRRLSS